VNVFFSDVSRVSTLERLGGKVKMHQHEKLDLGKIEFDLFI